MGKFPNTLQVNRFSKQIGKPVSCVTKSNRYYRTLNHWCFMNVTDLLNFLLEMRRSMKELKETSQFSRGEDLSSFLAVQRYRMKSFCVRKRRSKEKWITSKRLSLILKPSGWQSRLWSNQIWLNVFSSSTLWKTKHLNRSLHKSATSWAVVLVSVKTTY